MLLIHKSKILTFLSLAAIVLLGLILVHPGKALAAAPRCFNDAAQEVPCTSLRATNLLFLQDDKCYISRLNADSNTLYYVETDCNNPQNDNGTIPGGIINTGDTPGAHSCGGVQTTTDFGCKGSDNPVVQLLYAVIRFLSVGVGIIVVGSIVVAGIQYSTSQGNPQATAAALKRVGATVTALFIYLFMYAILNWLIPGGLFK